MLFVSTTRTNERYHSFWLTFISSLNKQILMQSSHNTCHCCRDKHVYKDRGEETGAEHVFANTLIHYACVKTDTLRMRQPDTPRMQGIDTLHKGNAEWRSGLCISAHSVTHHSTIMNIMFGIMHWHNMISRVVFSVNTYPHTGVAQETRTL